MARDFPGLERRRLQAAALFAQGVAQAAVARRLRASRQSVSRWHRVWVEAQDEGLRAAGRAGRRPRLDAAQRGQLEAILRAGPGACGYTTALWTLPRLAAVIRQRFGVRYHPGHVWKVLRALGWSCQKPTTRAKERDEAAIRAWRQERWPRIKRGHNGTRRH